MAENKIIKIVLDIEKSFVPKAEYIFTTFCRLLRLKPVFLYQSDINNLMECAVDNIIYYGKNIDSDYPLCIYHNSEVVHFFSRKNIYPNDEVNFEQYNDVKIPFLFSPKGEIIILNKDKLKEINTTQKLIITKDIIASSFYFLSCWQEYVVEDNIKPGDRYDYKLSMQCFWGFSEIPVVDFYYIIFRSCLEKFVNFEGVEFPILYSAQKHQSKKKAFSFILTLSHDIDYFDFWSRQHLYSIYKYNLRRIALNPLNSVFKLIGHFITKHFIHNPDKEINKILIKEKKLNCNSTSFLLSQSDITDERQNYFKNKTQLNKIKYIFRNQSVGLHGTKNASSDHDLLVEQLNRLKKENFHVRGYRNHYLCFNYQKSFKILEELGIEYDATLGFWEHIGFRSGTSIPFYPFNIEENRVFKVLEIPLSIMDVTLFSSKAMNMSYKQAKLRIFKMIDLAEKQQSHLSILWHINNFDIIDYPFWGKLCWDIIKYAKRKNGWVCSIENLVDHFYDLESVVFN
ncbi:MAG: hypothetical protein FWG98_05780 [Candidatus Cloacimonetes bacterium]|nr:hypothetical protein [Candidatus Cloacimonadota bacterium]